MRADDSYNPPALRVRRRRGLPEHQGSKMAGNGGTGDGLGQIFLRAHAAGYLAVKIHITAASNDQNLDIRFNDFR